MLQSTTNSWKVPRALVRWPDLSGDAKVVGLILWNQLGGQPGQIEVRTAELAAMMGRRHSKVALRQLRYLMAEGILEEQAEDRGTHWFTMHDPDEVAAAKKDVVQRAKTKRPAKKTPPAGKGNKKAAAE